LTDKAPSVYHLLNQSLVPKGLNDYQHYLLEAIAGVLNGWMSINEPAKTTEKGEKFKKFMNTEVILN